MIKISTKDDVVRAVNEYGIVPFFKNSIRGFSIEENVDPKIWFTSEVGPWEWKGPLIRENGFAYGKFFENKAAYVRGDVFLELLNYRRDGYDFDARFDTGKLIVDFTLKNTGELDGAEVWQIYVGDVYSTLSRPIKELRAFDKVFLRSGEQRRIHAEMTKDELGQFNVFLRRRVSEEGIYDVFVGASSRDIRLCDRIALKDETPYSVNHRNEDMIG